MNEFELGSVVSDDGFLRVLPCFRFGDWLVIFDTGDKSVKFFVESDYNQRLEKNYGKKIEFLEQDNEGLTMRFSGERSSSSVQRPPLSTETQFSVDSDGNPIELHSDDFN